MGSPSQKISVSGATTQYSPGSVSITLNSTLRMPPLTRKRSPFLTGRYDSKKYAVETRKEKKDTQNKTLLVESTARQDKKIMKD
jgi:hypothetical protein